MIQLKLYILISSFLYILRVSFTYYSLTTVNHVGTLISTDVYNSALDLINPIKRLLGFNILFIDATNTHKEWIELSVEINKYIVTGLCIYWAFIRPYMSTCYKKSC